MIIPIYEKISFMDLDQSQGGWKWAYFFGFDVSFNRVTTMWFEWITLILLNFYFTTFNSALYEDDSIVISETEKIDKLVNDISTWLKSDKDLGWKVREAFDETNPDKNLLDDEFDLKVSLDKINIELPSDKMTKDEVMKYMDM